MQIKECCWKRRNSVKLYGKLWIPDDPMSVLIVMVHGIGEHSGCYDLLAEKFASRSVGVLTFDLRGHGRSSGLRGHTSIKVIKEDIRFVINNMNKNYPDIPVVLFGHSMGGHMTLSFALDKKVQVQGFIASSPLLELVRPPSRLVIMSARLASHIMPWITVRTGVKSSQLSQNSVKKRSSKTDPLLHKRISIGLFSDIYTSCEHILHQKHQLDVPLLIMHGTEDTLTSYQASKLFAQNVGTNTSFKQWHGMHHDLLNDADNEAVFQYLMKWLSTQIIENGSIQNSRKLYRIA